MYGKKITLTDVLYMLDINRELILFKNMQKTGYNVTFKNDVAVVEECNEHYIMAKFNEKG